MMHFCFLFSRKLTVVKNILGFRHLSTLFLKKISLQHLSNQTFSFSANCLLLDLPSKYFLTHTSNSRTSKMHTLLSPQSPAADWLAWKPSLLPFPPPLTRRRGRLSAHWGDEGEKRRKVGETGRRRCKLRIFPPFFWREKWGCEGWRGKGSLSWNIGPFPPLQSSAVRALTSECDFCS